MHVPVIGITLGDQAGIGPELVDRVLQSAELPSNVRWKVIGDRIAVRPGHPTPESAQAAWDALEAAAAELISGELDAVVTAPVAKSQLQSIGYKWPGQTEFFAEKLHVDNFAMCLSGEHLTVGLVTIHEAIHNVPTLISEEKIIQVGTLLADFCRKKGIARPRIAVAALNPHASEEGAFGDEEERIIIPALEKLQADEEKLQAAFSGPHVPDALFREAYLGQYDAIVCMYHDQGLIPLKMVDFDTAINTTLGLPKPRVSPDHGTAFNIAGQGKANPASMLHACRIAARLVAHDPFPL